MASMPTYHVSKGPFDILDKQFGGKASFMANYQAVRNPLKGGPAESMLKQRAAMKVANGELTAKQQQHFDNDWLSEGYWSGLYVSDTLRWGVLEAINCAESKGLPMEFFWVCVEGPKIFQVYYSVGPQQVTVLVLTPSPNLQNAGPLQQPEDLWVVKAREKSDNDYPTVNGTAAGVVPAPVSLGPITSGPAKPANVANDIIRQQIWRA